MISLLKGVLKYNKNVKDKEKLVHEISKVTKDFVKAKTVFVSCMDCRVLPSNFISSKIGEVYFLRNAGNMVPHFDEYKSGKISSEGGGMELGCIVKKIRNIVVCGHSDCKALKALYEIRHQCDHKNFILTSPLRTWVALHGSRTKDHFLKHFEEVHDLPNHTSGSIHYTVNLTGRDIDAIIDPDNQFCIEDKFSQLHCLIQASHVKTYPMLAPFLESGELQIHALWYDVYSGNVYMFSISEKKFILVDDRNLSILLKDIEDSRLQHFLDPATDSGNNNRQ